MGVIQSCWVVMEIDYQITWPSRVRHSIIAVTTSGESAVA